MARTARIALVSALATLVVLVGAGSASAMTVLVGKHDSGRTVVLRKGDTVRLTLSENPSTGYRWRFRKRATKRVLRLVSSKFVSNPSSPGQVGVGGKHKYVFKARRKGRTSFRLGLFPPGKGRPIARRFSLKVRVS
jgi:inhibitor of cysteine peptidase